MWSNSSVSTKRNGDLRYDDDFGGGHDYDNDYDYDNDDDETDETCKTDLIEDGVSVGSSSTACDIRVLLGASSTNGNSFYTANDSTLATQKEISAKTKNSNVSAVRPNIISDAARKADLNSGVYPNKRPRNENAPFTIHSKDNDIDIESNSNSNNDNDNDNDSNINSNNDNDNTIVNMEEEIPTKDDGLEEITQQMGKLWYPKSNQELTETFIRDKHGRLVPSADGGGAKGTSNTNAQNTSGSGNNSEWYDSVMQGVHSATVNLVGAINDDKTIKSYERMDPKLHTSMVLTKTIDKVWAKELYDMDAREREDIINEIHGIKSKRAIEETQESIDQAVTSFRSYLETNLDKEFDNGDSIVPAITKDAYKRGVYSLGSDYITSQAFLIKFLRICYYDFEKAAQRYFRWLDLLHLLFGDDSLTRPLELADLTKRELRYLRKGQMQLLPSRDPAGRRIFAFSGCDDWNFNIREKYRTNIYLIDVLSDDIETQKLGAVSLNAPRVRYDLGDNPFSFEGMTLRKGQQELLGGKCTDAQFFRKINEAVPIRFSGLHYFAPATLIYNIGRAIILSMLGKDHRRIVRFHAGSQLECNYNLRSFGIPLEDITITEGNNIKTKNVAKFINARKSIESFRERQRDRKIKRQAQQCQQQPLEVTSSSNCDISIEEEECPGIECPGVNCIVFGDKTMNGLPANVEFREILKVMERLREESLNSCDANVLPIKQFVESIIDKARSLEHNLRFLVFDKTTHLFVDIRDHNELCKRVSQSLRDQRKRARIEEQRLAATEGRVPAYNVQSSNNGSSSSTEYTKSQHATNNNSNNKNRCVLEEAGASIMGLDAAKRLKRSYNVTSSKGNITSTDCGGLFCRFNE